MFLEATRIAFRFRLLTGVEVQFRPGVPVELPEQSAKSLLKLAGARVRRVSPEPVVVEPAAKHARLVFFERNDGRIYGPAHPEFLAQGGEEFWVIVTYGGESVWIRSDRLRSKQVFEEQVTVPAVPTMTPIRTQTLAQMPAATMNLFGRDAVRDLAKDKP